MQIKSVAEDLGVSEEDMSKAQKALDRLGISIEDSTTGSLKPLDTILEEVGAKWNTLTDVEKQYTSEMLAGNRQRNVFVALMNSMTQQQELYNKALESSGSLEEANNIKAESIDGKLNTLKDTVKEFWSNLINSGQNKTLIDDVTSFIEVIGSITSKLGGVNTLIVTLVGGLTLFDSKFRQSNATMLQSLPIIGNIITSTNTWKQSLEKSIKTTQTNIATTKAFATASKEASIGVSWGSYTAQLTKLNVKLAASKVAMVALKVSAVALQTAVSMGLSLAITEAITLITKLINKQKELREANTEKVNSFETENQDISKAEKLLSQQEEYKEKLSSLDETSQEYSETKKQLLDVEKQLADILPQTVSGYDDEGNMISENTELIKEQIKWKKENLALEAQSVLSSSDNLEESINKYKEEKENLENMRLAKKRGDSSYTIKQNGMEMTYGSDSLDKNIENSTKKLQEYTEVINNAQKSILQLKQAGWSDEDIMNVLPTQKILMGSDYEKLTIKGITDALKNQKDTTDELTKSQKRLKEMREKTSDYNEEEEQKSAKSDFTDSIEQIEKIQKIINEIGNSKKFDDNTIKSMVEMFPELAGHLDDISYCVDYMNQQIQGFSEAQKNAYVRMQENSEEYFKTNVQNTQEWTDITNKAYTILANSDNDYYKQCAKDMKNHFDNCKTLLEARKELEIQCAKVLAEVWGNYYKTLNQAQVSQMYDEHGQLVQSQHINEDQAKSLGMSDEDIANYNKKQDDRNAARKKALEDYENQIKAYDDLKTQLNNLNNDFSINTPDFVGTIGSNITDNKDNSKSKEKDYSVEDVEDLTDAYHDLNNAITLVEAKLKQLQARYENLYGKSKAQAMQEQVDILKQQLDLHSQMESKINSELAKQRSELASQGVTFDSSGMISNYNEILTSLRNQANAIQTVDENSKKAKEDSIKSLKDLKSKMDDYNSSITKDLEEQKTTWLELQNQIKETYKTMEKMVTDGESKVTDVIKNEIDKRKEKELDAIDEVKKALQDQWDTDDYDDQLQEAQDKVMEYEEKIANAIKLGDTNSLTELKKEQQDAIKELNDTVKQHERDTINDELDDQTDNINKKYEEMEKSQNLTQMVTEALQTGFIKINDEVISLSSAMDDFIKDSTVGIGTINQTTRELNETLADTLAMLNQLGGYSGLSNLLPNVPYQMLANSTGTIDRNTVFTSPQKSTNVKMGDIYINGNLDNVTLNDVKREINNANDKFIKKLASGQIYDN